MKRKHSTARREYDQFVRGYVTAALWSSHDESDESGGEPMDNNYDRSDIAASSMKSMKRDCARFLKKNKAALEEYVDQKKTDPQWGTAWDYAGHDFWLTRNGHGAGFWDRNDVEESVRDKLTASTEKFGTSDMYVGDDGKIYVSPER